MSNFNALNQDHLFKLLEPFVAGITPNITPIKYEALTPDCFLLLFRTTDGGGKDHFFVSLETDNVYNMAGAQCTIADWHGSFIEFLPLQSVSEIKDSDTIDSYKTEVGGLYFAFLAEVQRPTHKGYWSEATMIMPGDTIGDKIAHYSEQEQINIRKSLATILKHKVDASLPFLESLQAKRADAIVDDINKTDIVVSLYVQPDGQVECFYNYAHRTVGGKTEGEDTDHQPNS